MVQRAWASENHRIASSKCLCALKGREKWGYVPGTWVTFSTGHMGDRFTRHWVNLKDSERQVLGLITNRGGNRAIWRPTGYFSLPKNKFWQGRRRLQFTCESARVSHLVEQKCHPCAREKVSPRCPIPHLRRLSGGSRSVTRFTTGYLLSTLWVGYTAS